MKINVFFLALMVAAAGESSTQVTAELTGSVHVKIQTVEHFRHSVDCYWSSKGDAIRNFDDQDLSLAGGEQKMGSGALNWSSVLRSPFERGIRTVQLRSAISSSSHGERIHLELEDMNGYSGGVIRSSKCGNHDGYTRPEQAVLSGRILLQYEVPKNIWALRVRRQGKGVLDRSHMKPIAGILNPGYDLAKSDGEILWVRPGSVITQELELPKAISGSALVGSLDLEFVSLGEPLTTDQEFDGVIKKLNSSALRPLINTPGGLGNGSGNSIDDVVLEQFIQTAATLLHNPSLMDSAIKRMTTRDITQMSQNLFAIANNVFVSKTLGLPVKTMAALTAFELSRRLLQDMSSYCENIEVYLPLSDKKVKTLGLRAAGFWLNRGLLRVKNYGFEQYDALLSELLALESTGATYAQVMGDEVLRAKLNKSYELLSESLDFGASPFGAAAKDVKRTLSQFGSIGGGSTETNNLVSHLTQMDVSESQFVQDFLQALDKFSQKNNSRVLVTPLAEKLQVLKSQQKQISTDMQTNIRLLSVDRTDGDSGVMRTIVQLMSNQVTIFEQPLPEVPYFEGIRGAYSEINYSQKLMNKMKICIMGGQ